VGGLANMAKWIKILLVIDSCTLLELPCLSVCHTVMVQDVEMRFVLDGGPIPHGKRVQPSPIDFGYLFQIQHSCCCYFDLTAFQTWSQAVVDQSSACELAVLCHTVTLSSKTRTTSAVDAATPTYPDHLGRQPSTQTLAA